MHGIVKQNKEKLAEVRQTNENHAKEVEEKIGKGLQERLEIASQNRVKELEKRLENIRKHVCLPLCCMIACHCCCGVSPPENPVRRNLTAYFFSLKCVHISQLHVGLAFCHSAAEVNLDWFQMNTLISAEGWQNV